MNRELRHEGTVIAVMDDKVTVEIPVSSACAQCHAKAVCGSDIGQMRIISVKRVNDGHYRKGDKVVVSISRGMGMKAVLLAYIIPFVVLLVLLLTLQRILENEVITGFVSIGAVSVYYVTLAVFRKKIDMGFKFNIVEKIDK